MLLHFEGQAQIDDRKGGVIFAGRYLERNGGERIVICRVTADALMNKCLAERKVPTDALHAYRIFSEQINRNASALFDGGDVKPVVTSIA